MYQIFISHSSVEGHLGCFPFPDVMSRAAINVAKQVLGVVVLWADARVLELANLVDSVSLLRFLHTDFQSDCTNWQFYQE